MFYRVLIFASLIFTMPVWAGQTTSTIEKILIFDGNMLVYVYPTNGVTNPPGCHGSNGDYYSFLMTRPLAKEYFSGLLSAQARKATVLLVGTGTCVDQPGLSETLQYFRIED